MLGNHQVQASVAYASGYDYLNYQVAYSYLKFRPQFTVGFSGDTENNVFLNAEPYRREDSQFVAMTYPLARYDSIQVQLQATQRKVEILDDPVIADRLAGRENVAIFSFIRDVSQGRYLETTSGYRLQASYQVANPALDSTLNYRNVFLTANQFIPMHRESTFAMRLYGGASFGPDQQLFRSGGSDLLRGYGKYDADIVSSHFVISNLEYRFPLLLNMNYHVWFFFPDFLFKNLYGAVFTDNGILWNSKDDLESHQIQDIKNSFGVGLRFQTFVLQTFPLILQVDWARRTLDGEQVFYFGLGPVF